MKKGDNRGLSTIVATLLIILLVLVAVGIIWVVVRTMIANNAEQISLGKFTINLEIVSIKQTNLDVNIKVKRNVGEGDLEGILFSIFDGQNTHIYEKHNVTLDPLEMKTFVVNYSGEIISISIYPILESSSGKTTTGNLADTYYTDSAEEEISENCTADCTGKECGDNGCGGVCGTCSASTPYCVQGECSAEAGEEENCTCAATTCIGSTCDNGIGGSCLGELQSDCNNNQIMCGTSLNGCGSCGTCDTGYYCNEGICSPNCLLSDCGTRECGPLPGKSYCGTNFCGSCTIGGETCNDSIGVCFTCVPDCSGRECGVDPVCGTSCGSCNSTAGETCNVTSGVCSVCVPDCSGKECGTESVCGSICGTCDTAAGEYCESGTCVKDESVNEGTVFSVWPWPSGRMYFDSQDLPKSGENYAGYYVKIGSEYDCLRIFEYVTPTIPTSYNMTYMKISITATDIEPGDNYAIWENYTSCVLS